MFYDGSEIIYDCNDIDNQVVVTCQVGGYWSLSDDAYCIAPTIANCPDPTGVEINDNGFNLNDIAEMMILPAQRKLFKFYLEKSLQAYDYLVVT